jgi:hypothetical protein
VADVPQAEIPEMDFVIPYQQLYHKMTVENYPESKVTSSECLGNVIAC